jgi:FkbM family methyltransferase
MEIPTAIKDCRHGRLRYLTNDAYIGRSIELYGEYSEGEVILFRNMLRLGDVVLDVGANIGALTIPLAKLVGPRGLVYAFEPQGAVFDILTANIQLNALDNVRPRRAAAGAKPGAVMMPHVDYRAPGNFGGISVGAREGEEVPLVTIDSLDLPAARLIKIDVEGMEIDVLAGATATLRRLSPVLYIENDRPQYSETLIGRLFDLRYRAWWHLPPLFNEQNFSRNRVNIFGDTISINVVALPAGAEVPRWPLREILTPHDRFSLTS